MAKHLVAVWFFIGVLLDIYGVLILGSGIYDLVRPSEYQVRMAYLHAGIWWGLLVLVMGLIYTVRFAPKSGEIR